MRVEFFRLQCPSERRRTVRKTNRIISLMGAPARFPARKVWDKKETRNALSEMAPIHFLRMRQLAV